MDNIRIELQGKREFSRALKEYAGTCEKALKTGLFAGATATHGEAIRSIQAHASSGSVYTRRGVQHAASTPGNPPNSDTGNLVANITIEDISEGFDVGSRKGASYGAALEFGTLKMSPRPWLQPAYDKAVKIVIDKIMKSKAARK